MENILCVAVILVRIITESFQTVLGACENTCHSGTKAFYVRLSTRRRACPSVFTNIILESSIPTQRGAVVLYPKAHLHWHQTPLKLVLNF